MINKKGGNTVGVVIAVALVLGLVFAGAAYMGWIPHGTPQAGVGGVNNPQTVNTGGTTVISTTDPVVTVTSLDAQQQGTAVGFTLQGNTNGQGFGTVTSGTTTKKLGDTLDLLIVNNTGYHNAAKAGIAVGVNSFPTQVLLNKNATVTENLYTTTGLVTTNNGGTQNQTDLGNGASYSMKDEFSGTSLQSTQDMTCLIELTAGVNASTTPAGAGLSLNGVAIPVKSNSIPIWYTVAGANSRVWQFDTVAANSAAVQTYYVTLNTNPTGCGGNGCRFSAGSKVIKTCFTKEWFLDTPTGKLMYDVADTGGTLKSMASYPKTVVFQ